jgi:hypothetical protein
MTTTTLSAPKKASRAPMSSSKSLSIKNIYGMTPRIVQAQDGYVSSSVNISFGMVPSDNRQGSEPSTPSQTQSVDREQALRDRRAARLRKNTKIAFETKKIRSEKFRISLKLVVLSVLAIFISIVEQQKIWENKNKAVPECDGLKSLILLLSIVAGYYVVKKKRLLLNEQRAMEIVPDDDVSIWNCHLTREVGKKSSS